MISFINADLWAIVAFCSKCKKKKNIVKQIFGNAEKQNRVRGDVACDFEHAVVAVYRVGVVFRRIVKAVLVGVAVFLELHDALHQRRAFKVELGASSKKSF
jgi:hypothetical protein